MNKVKILSKLVALSLAAVATSGFAVPKDEEEDSVRSWGPWATLVQPAAGEPDVRTQTVAGPVVPGFGAGDASQFTPIVPDIPEETTPVVSDACAAGSNCGYALIDERENNVQTVRVAAINVQPTLGKTSPQRATPTLNPIPVQSMLNERVLALDAAQTTTLTINSNTALPLSQTIANAAVFLARTKSDVVGWNTMQPGGNIRGFTVNVKGTPIAYGSSNKTSEDSKTTNALFVYGQSTGLEDLSTLNIGNVEANYVGRTLGSNTEVTIDVDFGQGTWEGSFNGGTDGNNVRASTSTDTVNVLTGSVGFEASGTINGVNIVSTELTASDASAISGKVDGSFFGGEAGVLAGAVNVNKTTTRYTDGNYQDVYVTADQNKVSGALPSVNLPN